MPRARPDRSEDAHEFPAPVVGRRKEAIVRVRLVPGTGEFKLNGRTLDNYFPNKVHQQLIKEPFVTLEKDGQYDVIATLTGGGVTGQAGALRLAISRALIGIDSERGVPRPWNISRFEDALGREPHRSLLKEVFNVLIRYLGDAIPALGADTAGDATALSARRKSAEGAVEEVKDGLPQASGGR